MGGGSRTGLKKVHNLVMIARVVSEVKCMDAAHFGASLDNSCNKKMKCCVRCSLTY